MVLRSFWGLGIGALLARVVCSCGFEGDWEGRRREGNLLGGRAFCVYLAYLETLGVELYGNQPPNAIFSAMVCIFATSETFGNPCLELDHRPRGHDSALDIGARR